MGNTRFVALYLTLASCAFGQIDSNSITITATRTIYLQPDQVVLSVVVASGPGDTLDGIVAALTGLGISWNNLSSVGSQNSFFIPSLGNVPSPGLTWTFTLPVPFSKMKDTIAALMALSKTIGQNNSGRSLGFNVAGTQVSAQMQAAQQCSKSDLVSDARGQAQKVANAAGMTVGPVLAVSEPVLAAAARSNVISWGSTPAFRIGDFSAGNQWFVPVLPVPIAPTLPLTCSLIVKFGILR